MHRQFKDRHEKTWDVWQVHPSEAERRYSERRGKEEVRSDQIERRSGVDRRREALGRHPVAAEFIHGWLCFETHGEKRRLAPVPDGWDRADDDTLEQWCIIAKPVVRRPSGMIRSIDAQKLS